MDRLQFLVQGSASEPYQVTFRKVGDNLSAFCTCPAGQNGQYCKHRFSILAGSAKGIVSDNSSDLSAVNEWLVGSDVQAAMIEVERLEIEAERIKKELARAKKGLARAMSD
ncbi:MAG: SWIM zinc finger family protein [Pseudomonadales bacterium]